MPNYASRMERVRPSAIRELLRLGDDPSITSFGGGYPDPALFPMDDLRPIFDRLLTSDHALSLQYTASNGVPLLREQIAARLTADGMPATADDVLVVSGGQQGLDLAGRLVLDPGDVVVTENPTFLGALIAFNPCEPRYAAVPVDADGMDTDVLEDVLARHTTGARGRGDSGRVKLLYTIPDFQNPSGVTMSLERRHRLIELANRHDLLVVEDTPYRALRYEGTHQPTLKSLDTEGRVVHLGSFSKILAPGMRLGWALAAPEILAQLGLLKLAADTQCSTLNMAATSGYLAAHDIDAHIAGMCAAYRSKRDTMLETLAATFPAGVTWTRPEGGLFTWVSFSEGFDTGAFMRDHALPRARVAYVPGATFFPVDEEPRHARFSFSNSTPEQIVQGITALGQLLHEQLPG